MNWKPKFWIEHSYFGVGRISEDRGDRLDIDFVNHGKKTILKSTDLKAAVPPSPDFKFPHDKGISAVVTTYRTITREVAGNAIKAYNDGTYGGLKNPVLDRQALEMFADGLGSTSGKIGRQVEFIGRDYGGAAGFKAAYALVPDITRDIVANRERYEQAALSALPILTQVPSRDTIEILYLPFVKPLHGKSNWQVWGTKFWHFLNPDAFPIEDSRVDKFFVLTDLNSVDKYLKFLNRFREFAISHQEWLPHLRQVDGGLAWCDNKVWDKMCYGLAELDSTAIRC
jgi:hypothetical protein